ncbi:prohibitin family protein [Candidatus Dependentiae bacterium]|nr:MAG: prohibitin family protein [Candidatus Dependentiae bacterium]
MRQFSQFEDTPSRASQAALAVERARAQFRFIRNTVVIVILAILGLIVAFRSPVEVEAGTRYVVKSFGRTTGVVLEPGLHFIAPWQSGTRLRVQLMEIKETMDTPTSSGLPVSLESSSWVGLDPSPQSLIKFVNDIGASGFENLVTSAKRSATRNVIAGFSYEDLYSSNRTVASDKIFTEVKDVLAPKGIIVDRVLLRGVVPPQTTRDALEKKAAAQQAAEAMTYTIDKEQQEITRKTKEAEGISKANREISSSLTPEYLQWYYIKALEGLAHSTNTTFVIVPYDQKLTPMLNVNHK